jgi:cytochrome c5
MKHLSKLAAAVGAVSLLVAASASAADGAAVYDKACKMCHGAGMMGAPKSGDKAAWTARIAQGTATLEDHAIKGFKGMPAKGGKSALSDDEVKAAVAHMVEASK